MDKVWSVPAVEDYAARERGNSDAADCYNTGGLTSSDIMPSEKSQTADPKGQMLQDSTLKNHLEQAKAEGQKAD